MPEPPDVVSADVPPTAMAVGVAEAKSGACAAAVTATAKPGDVAAIAASIEQLLTDEPGRRAMGARALERACALSWARSARVVLDALEEVAAPRQQVA